MDYVLLELGQMLFGNPTQEYPVPREKWIENPYYELCFEILKIQHPYEINDNGSPKSEVELKWEAEEKEKYHSQFYGSTDVYDFSNDFFTMRSYCWDYEDEEEASKPNFEVPSENFSLTWYKYPFRSSYSSEKLNPKRWNDLIQKCIKSLEETK
jgi:hypothetical protein